MTDLDAYVRDEERCLKAIGLNRSLKTGILNYFNKDVQLYKLRKVPIPDLDWFINSDNVFSYLEKPLEGEWLDENEEYGQTFKDFIKLVKYQKELKPSLDEEILFVPLSYDDDIVSNYIINGLVEFIEIYFNRKVNLHEGLNLRGRCQMEDNGYYKQIESHKVLSVLKTFKKPNTYCVTGITSCDLYNFDDGSFSFGTSDMGFRVCVGSLARYDQTNELLLKKACSLVCHEIGHLCGLEHCIYYRCIMNGSNSIEEDSKIPLYLCPVCLKKLHFSLNFEIGERYARLMMYCQKYNLIEEYEWYKRRLNIKK